MIGMVGFWSAAGTFSTTPATAMAANKPTTLRKFEEELRNFMGWSCEEDAATGDLSGVGFAAISIAGFLVELYV
ncbi:MAG: hypothetical protein WCE49_13910 [Terrimicrobiaceae bacterium]